MHRAVHRTVLVVDVEGFGDRRRTNEHKVAVRAGLYSALGHAFDRSGIPWDRCYQEGCGDGIFVLAPADVPKVLFVDGFPRALVEALQEHNDGRRPEEQIRLRMALHAGEVQYDDHGVTGSAINLAFRLLDGVELKIALSQSVGVLAISVSSWFFEEVVRHSAASRPETYRCVEVKVKEVDTRAWICLPESSDSPFVPLPRAELGQRKLAVAGGETNQTLPRDTTAFIGREGELARLLASAAASMESGRVMAIHAIDGMAGVGKTALAIHVTHLLAADFPDGQLFVRLHAHTSGQRPADPVDVLATLLFAAGFAAQRIPAGVDARAAMWRNHLVGKRVLLILDDAAGHQQVEPLLPSSAGCLVLVTSRRRLTALDAALTLPLDTLPPDEAVALFSRLSGRPVATADTGHLAEIAWLAGYLPLAISLVASRLRHHHTWSVADLVVDLRSSHGRMLEIQAEDVAVAAAFDLSYRDLPANERRFFCYLGLHLGPELDVHGAAALADVSIPEASGYLDALYNDHLLEESAPGRYRMHDLVRDYARECVQEGLVGDREGAVARLMHHYQRTARVADDHICGRMLVARDTTTRSIGVIGDLSTALAWLQTERSNLVACVDYLRRQGQRRPVIELEDALTSFLWVTGPWDQAILLRSPEDGPRDDLPSRAYALNQVGEDLRSGGNFSGAIEAHTRALEIYRSLNLPELRKRMANTLSFLGIARLAVGDLRGAIGAQMQARRIFRRLDCPLAEAYVLNELGVIHRIVGNTTKAASEHAEALDIFRSVGGDSGAAFALVGLGSVRRLTGDICEAVSIQRQALDIYRTASIRVGEADALNELGAAVGESGDFVAAEEFFAQACAVYTELGHSLGLAETRNNMGILLRRSGNPRKGHEEHKVALLLASEVHSSLEKARALDGLASCEFELDQAVDAASHLREADSIYQEIGAARGSRSETVLPCLSGCRRTQQEMVGTAHSGALNTCALISPA